MEIKMSDRSLEWPMGLRPDTFGGMSGAELVPQQRGSFSDVNMQPPRVPSYYSVRNARNDMQPTQVFTTAKGSTYAHYPDSTTIRDKMPRPEHPGEGGLQLRSGRTIYMDPNHVNAIGGIDQNQDIPTRLEPIPNQPGMVGNKLTDDWGPYKAGQFLNPVVPYQTSPQVGLSPVEMWGSQDGRTITHYGNEITHMQDQ